MCLHVLCLEDRKVLYTRFLPVLCILTEDCIKSQAIIGIDKLEVYDEVSNQNGLALFSDMRMSPLSPFPCHLNGKDLLIMVQRRLGSVAMY